MDPNEKLRTRLESRGKLLLFWKAKLKEVKQSQPEYPPNLQKKLHILARLRQINIEPYKDKEEEILASYKIKREIDLIDGVEVITNKSSDPISQEYTFNSQLTFVFDDMIPLLQQQIEKKQKQLIEYENLNKNDELSILKERTRILTKYLKVVISSYLFQYEFKKLFNITASTSELQIERINSKKEKFLKLLETLLNNSVVENYDKWILLRERDDPLIRFLVLNQLVVVDPRNKNRIKLKTPNSDIGV